MKEFKGVWIPYEILTDIKLNDKEKFVYSMILYLCKEKECIMSNLYISELLTIYRNVNTYEQNNTRPINTNVKEIINYNKNKYKSSRDYSDFDWTSLYANNS